MNKSDVLQSHQCEVGVVPVVRAASPEEAIQVIEAIKTGGLSILEITMTVPRAVKVIEEVASRYGDEVLVGAGTVLDAETARDCIRAGANFVVSPSLNLQTIEFCLRESIAESFPGALTPTGGSDRVGRLAPTPSRFSLVARSGRQVSRFAQSAFARRSR